jgi:osmotically-inducible protein OsmY
MGMDFLQKGAGEMAVGNKLTALRVKANLIANRAVGLMEINVEVEDGVAVLTGEVQTEEQKRIAEEVAYQIEEIDEVINQIQVAPPHDGELAEAHLGYSLAEGDVGQTAFAIAGESAGPGPAMASSEQFPGEFTDEQIECEAREKLASQSLMDASDVRLRSVNQIVHLEGSVATAGDLYNLHDMVLSVRGVMGISSEVSVREGEAGTASELAFGNW